MLILSSASVDAQECVDSEDAALVMDSSIPCLKATLTIGNRTLVSAEGTTVTEALSDFLIALDDEEDVDVFVNWAEGVIDDVDNGLAPDLSDEDDFDLMCEVDAAVSIYIDDSVYVDAAVIIATAKTRGMRGVADIIADELAGSFEGRIVRSVRAYISCSGE